MTGADEAHVDSGAQTEVRPRGYDDTSIETTVVRPRTESAASEESRPAASEATERASHDGEARAHTSNVDAETRVHDPAPAHEPVRERQARSPLRASDLPPLPEDAFRTQG